MSFSLQQALTNAVNKTERKALSLKQLNADAVEMERAREYQRIMEFFEQTLQPICPEFPADVEEIKVEAADKLPPIYKATFRLKPGANIREHFGENLKMMLPELEWQDEPPPMDGSLVGKWRTIAIYVLDYPPLIVTPFKPGVPND